MKKEKDDKNLQETIGFQIIEKALEFKWVKVDREKFLRETLSGHISSEMLNDAIKYGTAYAKVPLKIVHDKASSCIKNAETKSTAMSAITGLPGGIGGISVGISADIVQFYSNMIALIQKLVYLYGMKEINNFDDLSSENDELAIVILIFLGVACGLKGLDRIIEILLKGMTIQYLKQSSKLILFAKPAFYTVAKKVAKSIGMSITKKSFAKAAAKSIPFISAGISGTLNFITFAPMAKKLQHALEDEYEKPFDEQLIVEIERKLKNNEIIIDVD